MGYILNPYEAVHEDARKWKKQIVSQYPEYFLSDLNEEETEKVFKKIKERNNDLKIKHGDTVEFIHNPLVNSRCYPPFGTKGIVKNIYDFSYRIQWEKGTTASDGIWFADKGFVRKVKGD